MSIVYKKLKQDKKEPLNATFFMKVGGCTRLLLIAIRGTDCFLDEL